MMRLNRLDPSRSSMAGRRGHFGRSSILPQPLHPLLSLHSQSLHGATRSLSSTPLASAAFRRPIHGRPPLSSKTWPKHAAAPQACYSTATVEAVDPDAARVEQEAKTESENDPDRQIGKLYFDSAFPIRLGFWDLRYMLARFEKRSVLDRIKASLPSAEQVGHDFRVIGAEERMKDGGAFITFSYRQPASAQSPETIEEIQRNLQRGVKRVFNPATLIVGTPGVHLVRGKPFREDMNLFPSSRVHVKLEGGDASEEQLWQVLRPFGRILSINKDKPGEAIVTFSRIRGATSAKNCAHGYVLKNGARLVLTFRSHLRGKHVWDWITNHPRIVFPVLAFLLGGLTYVVFDPVREFMVESKIRNTFSLQDYKLYTWIKNNTVGLFHDQQPEALTQDDWWERREAASSIQEWIRERPSTFITISGPRGSGKTRMIEKVLAEDVQHLVINCDNIARTAKNDALLVSALASETGYWPVFSFLNSFNNMIDLAAVGLIGSKAGFAKPVDAQLKQVLGVLSSSLNHLNEQTQRRLDKEKKKLEKAERQAARAKADAPSSIPSANEKRSGLPSTGSTGSMDELVAAPEKAASNRSGPTVQVSEGAKPAEATKAKAKARETFDVPVVVIQQFHHKGLKQAVFHEAIAEWAAEMVSNGVAHVIFVSDNPVSMGKELTKALPNVPFQSIALADADEDKARSYVFNKLKELGRLPVAPASETSARLDGGVSAWGRPRPASENTAADADPAPLPSAVPGATKLDSETAAWVDKLGGRLTDLENLVQKISLGQSVEVAVEEIISRTVVELRKNAFGEDSTESKALPWKGSHAWKIIKTLADQEEVNYYGLLHDSFKGDEASLKALEGAEIITVRHYEGRPSVIRAGRPVLREAMKRMVDDRVFNDTQTLLANTASIESAEKQLRAIEAEIGEVSSMVQGSPFKVAMGGGGTGAVVDEDPSDPPLAVPQSSLGSSLFGSSGGGGGAKRTAWPAPVVVAPISAADAARARTEFLMSKMAALQSQISKLDAENARIRVRLTRYREG